jgi:transcriptional regulator with PAS, ATPase and Fis domain
METIIGNSFAIQQAKDVALQISESDAPVLLVGETGVGKELFADFIQSNSPRKTRPFVKVNCAAIQDALLESDLFGHERGAFTGAVAKKVGKLQIAHTGTVFLDEVPNMSLAIQAKMLRAIEYQKFETVGGTETVQVDLRIISASNKNMNKLLVNGQFRSDLFFRLGVFILHIPSLRERKTDIDILAKFFANTYKQKYNREILFIDPTVLKVLNAYAWPGNVRELKNVMERAVLFCQGDTITKNHIALSLDTTLKEEHTNTPVEIDEFVDHISSNGFKHKMTDGIATIEKSWILRALSMHGYVQKDAAKELGVSPRVLCYKMKSYKINSVSPYKGNGGGPKPKQKENSHGI